MQYLHAELAFYITITSNIAYALLFIYHFVKKQSNKSLMILAGCLCLSMVLNHVFISYRDSLDMAGEVYLSLIVNYYLVMLILNAIVIVSIALLHQVLKVPCHYVVRYIFRCMLISIALNMALHFDVMIVGNKEPYELWTLYSIVENGITVFMFFSVLIARKWSEVFKWLQLAHSH